MILVLGLATAVVVAVLDQLSKAAVLAYFSGRAYDADRVTPIFNLVLTLNRGMGFGLFNARPGGTAGRSMSCFSRSPP